MTIVHLRVGKAGITESLIEEIKKQILESDPLTIKFMQNFRESHDRKQAAQEIADKTGFKIKKFVGGTLTLTRKH